MTTSAKKVYGTIFSRGGTAIAEITDLNDVGPDADMLDVTSLDSADGHREFIAGLVNSGEFTIGINFLQSNSGHATMQTDLKAGTSGSYAIAWSGSSGTWAFTALVKTFKAGGAVGDKLSGTVTFQISGKITVS